MAAKNEGSGSSSSANPRDSHQLMEDILSQLNFHAGRYQRGFIALMKKIKEAEKAERELDFAMENAKNQLNNHLHLFTRLITKPQRIETAEIRETMEEEKEKVGVKRKKVPPEMAIMNLIQRMEKQAKTCQETVNEKKALQVKEVLNTIEEIIETFDIYKMEYEEATMNKLEEHNQELEKVRNTLRGMSISLSEFAQQLNA